MATDKSKPRNPWLWIPSLYFAEGMPYIVVMTVSVVMYKRLGISNAGIAFYTSWLYLPWVIKPFWSPLVDLLKTKRWWIVVMQLMVGAGLAGVALTLPTSFFFKGTLAFFWLLAFSSATHDIAADGFYMMGLNENQQAFFVGIRSTFYRVAMITGQGLLVILAGFLEKSSFFGSSAPAKQVAFAWTLVFFILAAVFFMLSVYHRIFLPYPADNTKNQLKNIRQVLSGFGDTIVSYFNKKEIWVILGFLLLYRLGESQLVKMASPFLLDSVDTGGLGLSTSEVGLVYGTIGIFALVVGGVLGGWLASVKGLKRLLWFFVFAMNLPHLVYVYLAFAQPGNFGVICSAVALEQFGYGFGYTAYTLYMLYISAGKHQTAHYAFSTGLMALGMMIPGMVSGWLQEKMGYQHFFLWVMLCSIPPFIMVALLKIDKNFGVKKK
jgi:MFS transporter, PAT family, beta-lactamase induction signal transducer AmpG